MTVCNIKATFSKEIFFFRGGGWNYFVWFFNELILQGRMIGLVVAETKELGHLAKEDRSILATCFKKGTKVGYILSLGTYNLETSFLGLLHNEGEPHAALVYLPHPCQ